MNVESAVSPTAHLCDQVATDQFFGNQQFVNMSFKQLAQNIFSYQSGSNKRSVRAKTSRRNQCMNVGIPVQKITRCCNRKDACRQRSLRRTDFEILSDRLPGASTQFRQQFSIE